MKGKPFFTFFDLNQRQRLMTSIWPFVFIIILAVFLGWRHGLGLFFWISGYFLGWLLFEIDILLDWFWLRPQVSKFEAFRHAFGSRDLNRIFELLLDRSDVHSRLLFHSVLFEAFLIVLGVYVVYSSTLLFPVGFVLGMLGRCVWIQVQSFMQKRTLVNWFWQFDVDLPETVQGLVVVCGVIAALGLTLISL